MNLNFKNDGIESLGQIFDQRDCKKLLREIKKTRNLNKLFLSPKEFKETNNTKGYNPKPGRNLLEKLNSSFIFDNKTFVKKMKNILGKYYRILDYKLVMGFPQSHIPDWIKKKVRGSHSINLAKFIKPKYRDITYFYGIDFHQDIIDFPDRPADFVTVYIYLDKVDANCSPLHIIPKSHKGGATSFPHQIKINNKKILYKPTRNKKIHSKFIKLLGQSGSTFFWHPFILHGTQPQRYDKPRLSVRILVEKNRRGNLNCEMDKINRKIFGKKSLIKVRNHLDKKGKDIKKNNFINKIK